MTIPNTQEDLQLDLNRWVYWLTWMLLGALVGGLVTGLMPTQFRAQATVVVDFNTEQTWQGSPDNELFYFLDREARKLEEVAWADDTLNTVATATGISITELRSSVLELSQPKDGGWHFYASATTPEKAREIAAEWSASFYQQAQDGLRTAEELALIDQKLVANPNDASLLATRNTLTQKSKSLLPGTEVTLSQDKELEVEKIGGMAYGILAGTLIGLLLGILIQLLGVGKKSA